MLRLLELDCFGVEIKKPVVDPSKFNRDLPLPFSLRVEDFAAGP